MSRDYLASKFEGLALFITSRPLEALLRDRFVSARSSWRIAFQGC
jgi:hypothetical protein